MIFLDLVVGEWGAATGDAAVRTRQLQYTKNLTAMVGPKCCYCTETQKIHVDGFENLIFYNHYFNILIFIFQRGWSRLCGRVRSSQRWRALFGKVNQLPFFKREIFKNSFFKFQLCRAHALLHLPAWREPMPLDHSRGRRLR